MRDVFPCRDDPDCRGHLPGSYDLIPFAGPMSVTMLRQPASRIRSSFYHNETLPFMTREQKQSLVRAQSIRQYVSVPGVGNLQTKLMAGVGGSTDHINEHHLKLAIENLHKMAFFGLQEYFDSSVCMFFRQYGGVRTGALDEALFALRESTSDVLYNPREPLGRLDVGAVYFHDGFDVQLYREAVRLFKARARALNFTLLEDEDDEEDPRPRQR